MLKYETLETVIGRELGSRNQECTEAVWPNAAEEGAPAFFARHADESVDGMLVITSVLGGESSVVLHADVDDIGRVAGHAAKEARGRSHGDKGGE